jgi:hypothetical protein
MAPLPPGPQPSQARLWQPPASSVGSAGPAACFALSPQLLAYGQHGSSVHLVDPLTLHTVATIKVRTTTSPASPPTAHTRATDTYTHTWSYAGSRQQHPDG